MRIIRSNNLLPDRTVDTRATRTVDTIITAIAFAVAVAVIRGLFWWLAGV